MAANITFPGLSGNISFLGGYRAGTNYSYRNKNLFKSISKKASTLPDLYLTDFEDIQVISRQFLGCSFLVKCTFIDEKESIASVSNSMLEVIQAFVLNKKYFLESDECFFPKSTKDFIITLLIVFILIAMVK